MTNKTPTFGCAQNIDTHVQPINISASEPVDNAAFVFANKEKEPWVSEASGFVCA